MANSNPIQTPEFKAQQVPKYGDQALSSKVVGTRYPVDVDAALRQIADHQGYIRKAVEEKLRADGLL
ncbi:MAG: hypothetical protein KME13_24315 [Myxacorys californica WJT36-NPBG1]|jgi:hypothetical protein|nr:hypothetical protein [Myxacorys californica WJT36-NPBG1]